jgi:hypothetical protein
MSELSNGTKKHTAKFRETIPLNTHYKPHNALKKLTASQILNIRHRIKEGAFLCSFHVVGKVS